MSEDESAKEYIDENEIDPDDIDKVKDDNVEYGCKHYKCHCAYVSPCCTKVYTCRICHDESELHTIDRRDVKELICLDCKCKQKVGSNCNECGVLFGRYSCLICRLFDDNDKKQFHCDGCGICRVGGRENFFHCVKCNMCLGKELETTHKCIENVAHDDCPVCLENLHTSRDALTILKCGHLFHKKCFSDMIKTGNYACPRCCQSMCDMSSVWKQMDEEVEQTPMPDEFKFVKKWVLCRDCHKSSRAKFHVVGMKCLHCGSYNTCDTTVPVQET